MAKVLLPSIRLTTNQQEEMTQIRLIIQHFNREVIRVLKDEMLPFPVCNNINGTQLIDLNRF